MQRETNMKRNLSEADKRERQREYQLATTSAPTTLHLCEDLMYLGRDRIEQSELTRRAATAIQREG
mgnify:CR=1 FL=1